MSKTKLISPGSIPNHTLKKNLKTNGNAIETATSDDHDVLKTPSLTIIKQDDNLAKFNPDEVAAAITFVGETSFQKTGGAGHALKINPDGNNFTGGRMALSGTASQPWENEQVNGVLEFQSSSGAVTENTRALGGYIRNLTKGYGNVNATNKVTAGGIIGIQGSSSSNYGAVGVTPTSVTGSWVASNEQIISQTGTSGGNGTEAQFKVVTDGSGNPKVTLIMNQAISPRIISNGVSFNKTNNTITLSGAESNWLALGYNASGTNQYGRTKMAGCVITVSGAAETSNNDTFIIKSFNHPDTPTIATIWDNQSDSWVDIPNDPLTTESASNTVTIYGGGSGKNYTYGEVITLTDTHDDAVGATLTVVVKSANGDYPSYTSFGTCDNDNWIASERMRIMHNGNVGIGTKAPQNLLSVQPTLYNTGWASQSGTTITGYGTTWTTDMVGKYFVFNNGHYAGKITAYGGATSLTVGESKTVNKQAYRILHFGLQVTNTGLIIGEIVNTSASDQDNSANQASLQYQGVTGASQTINNIGSDINVNSNLTAAGGTLAINAAGIIKNTGIDLDIASGTSGTQSAIGIDIGITGGADSDSADSSNNIGMQITQVGGNHIKLLKDANDYATIAVADTGDLTIATVGDGTTDSDLILDIDGDIELNADGGDISFKDASSTLGTFSTAYGGLNLPANTKISWAQQDDYIYADTTDIFITKADTDIVAFKDDQVLNDVPFKIKEAASAVADTAAYGQIWVKTATPNELYFTNDAGNDIQITSGTELVPHSGTILGITCLRSDGSNFISHSIQTSFTVEDSTHQITFNTPPSENVEIVATAHFDTTTTTDVTLFVGLSDNSTYNSIGQAHEYDQGGIIKSDDEADDHVKTMRWVLTSTELASVGSSNTFYIGFKTSDSLDIKISYGERNAFGLSLPPFIIKAIALPSTIYTG